MFRLPTPPRRLIASLALAGALVAWGLAPAARAEDETDENDVSAQVKAQMEKIIELMRQNEEALLRVSAGQDGQPRPVDVVPPEGTNSSGGSSGSSSSSGSSGSQGSSGGDVVRKIDELIRGQRQTASGIPGELEELVRMIPT